MRADGSKVKLKQIADRMRNTRMSAWQSMQVKS